MKDFMGPVCENWQHFVHYRPLPFPTAELPGRGHLQVASEAGVSFNQPRTPELEGTSQFK